ncbi:hypothetical protein M427DRAFT_32103 [Gonapodya prolifera JEL478]|uniref:Transcription factor TFIIIC triple barrel domain-containing protein n=1 Tax=Gonapodya prolifera (strain JEL478) TaxID=1344416 RepID=A0A139AGV1_GONPJ|nr:hypothetical protein M427DRAFT_32103 [Gonapodya prolifera JEL478]|eukprot:KXS15675.1 hypothetical protein M427DRAFT_32103 [Gonapodya prolifera JEL478]
MAAASSSSHRTSHVGMSAQQLQNDDDDWEEETTYALLDLGRHTPSSLIRSALDKDPTYQLIGLDTPTPYLRLGHLVFRGKHERTIGTELIIGPTGWDYEDRRAAEAAIPLGKPQSGPWIDRGPPPGPTMGPYAGGPGAGGIGGIGGAGDQRYEIVATTRRRVHMTRVQLTQRTDAQPAASTSDGRAGPRRSAAPAAGGPSSGRPSAEKPSRTAAPQSDESMDD